MKASLHIQIRVESFMRGHSPDTKKVSITRAVLTVGNKLQSVDTLL